MFRAYIVLPQPVGFTDSQFHRPFRTRSKPRIILDYITGRRQFFDGPQYIFRCKSQLSQHLSGYTVFIKNETEQDMLCPHIVMTQALRSLLGILQHPFCIISKSVVHILSHPYTLVRTVPALSWGQRTHFKWHNPAEAAGPPGPAADPVLRHSVPCRPAIADMPGPLQSTGHDRPEAVPV